MSAKKRDGGGCAHRTDIGPRAALPYFFQLVLANPAILSHCYALQKTVWDIYVQKYVDPR